MITIKEVCYNKWDRPKEAKEVFDSINQEYKTFNSGLHWILETHKGEIHYWPTTGKWRNIDTYETWEEPQHERFLTGLLTYMGVEHDTK